MKLHGIVLVCGILGTACSNGDEGNTDPEGTGGTAGTGGTPGAVDDGCERGKLESDMVRLPMTGPKVDESGALAAPGPDGYVVSSTFLRLRPGDVAAARFSELLGPVLETLNASPGMEAVALATSPSCETARTLSVWSSAEAMYDFVSSPAHLNAIDSVGEVSRGGSVVVHWAATSLEDTTWEKAAEKLAAAEGPFY